MRIEAIITSSLIDNTTTAKKEKRKRKRKRNKKNKKNKDNQNKNEGMHHAPARTKSICECRCRGKTVSVPLKMSCAACVHVVNNCAAWTETEAKMSEKRSAESDAVSASGCIPASESGDQGPMRARSSIQLALLAQMRASTQQ